jgi:hypothetical protein
MSTRNAGGISPHNQSLIRIAGFPVQALPVELGIGTRLQSHKPGTNSRNGFCPEMRSDLGKKSAHQTTRWNSLPLIQNTAIMQAGCGRPVER